MSNEVTLAPMGKLLNLIETARFKLEYHFDDLVFIDNTSLLFRFDKQDSQLVNLHFNVNCTEFAKEKLSVFLISLAKEEKLKLTVSSSFKMEQIEGKEEFQVVFNDK
jgi:hypothetical protein